MSINADNTKEKIKGRFSEIKVGDVIFDDCDGPAGGGAAYGSGWPVTEVTETEIISEVLGKFSRETGNAIPGPCPYYIGYWQRG